MITFIEMFHFISYKDMITFYTFYYHGDKAKRSHVYKNKRSKLSKVSSTRKALPEKGT